MARNSLLCADVPLRNYSLAHSRYTNPAFFHLPVTVCQYLERLPQQLVDRAIMRSFCSMFATHSKTTALRAGELTVNTLAGVSRSWWKAVGRCTVSTPGRQLRQRTRHKINGKIRLFFKRNRLRFLRFSFMQRTQRKRLRLNGNRT